MPERNISPKERGIHEQPARKTEKPAQHRVGEQVPYPLPTEAEIAKSLRQMEQRAQGGAERPRAKEAREREISPMERIKKLGSMLAKNITGLRMLGPTGRKIGKGLLLAYAFGLAAETGAVWQAKNMHKDEMMRRLGQESIAADIKSGKLTRKEAVDLVAERSMVNLEIKQERSSSGIKGFEERVAAELGRIGALWAAHEMNGDQIAPDEEQEYVRKFREDSARVVEEYVTRERSK